jgi:hypothetical protein
MPSAKKGIRVGGASGGFTDRQRSILDLAKCDLDVIIGVCSLAYSSRLRTINMLTV